ncbi:unnamed protein product [Cladocopium goreaui]|uniref:Uncharacterized protein n=1 Tax=Cladocopium goreaui TaxID=2562237 RepID=A0A9P1C2H1_9DINO|nr:unnamed protein product [Cladocopium goreaui]
MRQAMTLGRTVESFQQFRRGVAVPWVPSGSVDPRGLMGKQHAVPHSVPSIRVTSVFGGHCSLWLEPLYTLYRIFPESVLPLLATYNPENSCSEFFAVELPAVHLENNDALRHADLLVCMWVSECSRLRAHYSKPVIFYSGFLLLNDQSFHPGHAWMEPLHHFWRRVADLLACDGPGEGHTGPPCLVVFEERQLAEAAYWQTGQQKPYVRPLSLYVGCTHDPEKARSDVLVINRGRLVLDGLVTQALNAMKHAAYPHSFVDQVRGMPFASMAAFRAAILLPWDLNLVMFHDLYAMAIPMFLPNKVSLEISEVFAARHALQ